MRILLLSDTHGVIHPPILALAEDCDAAVHAGDIGNAAVLSTLAQHVGMVLAVLGNNDSADKWPENDQAILNTIPLINQLELPNGLLKVEHGDRVNPAKKRHEKLRKRHPDAQIIVYGHSHHQAIDKSEDVWVVNPGAAGRSRTYGGPSCLILQADKELQIKPYRFSL